MTDDQKKYYNAMKKLSASGPAKATPRPKVNETIHQQNMLYINIRAVLLMLSFEFTYCCTVSNSFSVEMRK